MSRSNPKAPRVLTLLTHSGQGAVSSAGRMFPHFLAIPDDLTRPGDPKCVCVRARVCPAPSISCFTKSMNRGVRASGSGSKQALARVCGLTGGCQAGVRPSGK